MHELRRTNFREDGIFSEFSFDDSPGVFCRTLEHSYDCKAKLPCGIYTCVRGMHTLHNGIPFETFEITGVVGHKGILFHAGNFNRDSEGCVLVGKDIAVDPNTGDDMITGSKVEFKEFMARLEGVQSFKLEVT